MNEGSAIGAMVSRRVARRVSPFLRALTLEGPRNDEHMKFPEISRTGDPSHASATARLTAARREECRLATTAHAARGSADEAEAASQLSAASAEVAAREAWLGWVEHGV